MVDVQSVRAAALATRGAGDRLPGHGCRCEWPPPRDRVARARTTMTRTHVRVIDLSIPTVSTFCQPLLGLPASPRPWCGTASTRGSPGASWLTTPRGSRHSRRLRSSLCSIRAAIASDVGSPIASTRPTARPKYPTSARRLESRSRQHLQKTGGLPVSTEVRHTQRHTKLISLETPRWAARSVSAPRLCRLRRRLFTVSGNLRSATSATTPD
jgi:hypothetical protein